ncbi:ATP-dependent DNA helicase RecQ [Bacteroidia bacterium]|nr:ATP-dependent DNA helicase RecQ [Bacteroidia bacterium]
MRIFVKDKFKKILVDIDSSYIHSELFRLFGFDRFKGDQENIIKSLMQGKNVFVIMPTGGGKSLCYQFPALISKGTAIIVSPLISLMRNQVDMMKCFGNEIGIAHYLNSSLSKAESDVVKEDILSGKTKMLYVAPESLTKKENLKFFKTFDISFFAIDEAHCISEWGHNFRPDYRKIKTSINDINKNIPIIALTATATEKVRIDIIENLDIKNADIFISSFNRPNLYYEVRSKTKNSDKDIVRFIHEHKGKSGIIYCLSRKKVEEIANLLNLNNIRTLPYHAGLSSVERAENQDKFQKGVVDIIVATIAFGMGIDKPDVRFVIHYNMPRSLESYYQETGRAGRDGGEGKCIAFFSDEDIKKIERFILKEKEPKDQEKSTQLISETVSYAHTGMCRRKNILHYFGEDYPQDSCDNCDNCLHPKKKSDISPYIKTVLEMMAEIKEPCKNKIIAGILTGENNATIKNKKYNLLDFWGEGKNNNFDFWMSVIREATMLNLLTKDLNMYGCLKITDKGSKYIKQPFAIMIANDIYYDSDEEDDEYLIDKSCSTDSTLLSMLKTELQYLAEKHNVNAWALISEQSLIDMTIQYPTTIEEMAQISGMGANKAKKYSEGFIRIIKEYVEENEIIRPQDIVFKSIVNKSANKVFIIQSIDKQLPLDEIAKAKGLSLSQLTNEMTSIIKSGCKLNIDYYISENVASDHYEDIIDYFTNCNEDNCEKAWKELGENEYSLDEIKLVRLKYLVDVGM